MGCAPSSRRGSTKGRKGVHIRGKGRDEDTDSYIECARSPPRVTVSLGSGVSRTPDHVHTVIFIFGGPGSQKGIITQELVQEFEFVSLSIEDIVFSFMPNKVANTVENVSEIQELLRRDTGVLTLEWVLNMVSARLSTSMSQRFIIDIVPELQNIMRADSFKNRNHEKHLENFERRHPVLFALELVVSEEKSLLSGKTLRGPESEQINRKELSPELSAFLKGIDEADKGRLEKRIDNYHKCSEPFLEYFRRTRRVIQMDLKVPGNENVVKTVRETLNDFGFSRNSDNIRVVMFVMNERQIGEIDLDYYRLRRVRLSEVAPDRNETFNAQIRAIRRFINRTAESNENFFIVLDILNKPEITGMKKINFIEPRETYLEYYIKSRLPREPYARCKMALNAITSTTEEVCLFPRSFSTELARKISFAFSERLSLAESEALSSSTEPTLSNGSSAPHKSPS